VMGNGGLIAPCGSHVMALAAQHHAIPFVVCTGIHKLSPLYLHDQDTFNDLRSPSAIVKFEEVGDIGIELNVLNPAYDYVTPDLVSLYITNGGGHNASYIYRLLSEHYDPEDSSPFA